MVNMFRVYAVILTCLTLPSGYKEYPSVGRSAQNYYTYSKHNLAINREHIVSNDYTNMPFASVDDVCFEYMILL
jgi:hypothetical protein